MRRNASPVVVLAGSAPGEVLAAVGRSMNVTLIRPEEPADSCGYGLAAAAGALQRPHRVAVVAAAEPAQQAAASCRPSAHCGTVPGGRPWTR